MLGKLKDIAASNPESLQYAPSFLQRIALGIMAILTLISFALANAQALLWMHSDWLVSTILPAVIVDLTNEERIAMTTPLARNEILDTAARLKAEHMAAKGYFAHYSPDGISPWYWFDEVDYSFVHAGENLAVLFTDSEDVVEAWMDSPGHKANILNEAYTEIGVGTAHGNYKGRDTVFVVQLFGTPAQSATREIISDSIPIVGPVGAEETVLSSTVTDVVESSADTDSLSDEQQSVTGERVGATVAAAGASTDAYRSEVTIMRSDVATTSRAGAAVERETGFFGHLATQPHSWLQFIYALLAFAVIALLASSVVLAWRKEHTVQILYGAGLVCVMAFLLVVHAAMSGGAVVV